MNESDRKLIFKLAAELTGAAQTGDLRQDSLVANVRRRMEQTGFSTLVDYLHHVDKDPDEHAQLVSALSIHTTSWFRENPHFVAFQEHLLRALKNRQVFRLWCAACSTGEEAYSFALMLEEFRLIHPQFEYEILGTDVDPVSVMTATRAVYPVKGMNFHVQRYKHHLLMGSGPTEGFFTLHKNIRSRCHFEIADLRNLHGPVVSGPFEAIVCRNVLIYFDAEMVRSIVSSLVMRLAEDGRLLLGHSEAVSPANFGLTQEGHSVYSKGLASRPTKGAARRLGKPVVLCVDDSLLARKFMEKTLTELGFQVVTVGSGTEATNFLNFNDVDLITLDLNMPDVSGEKWLQNERAEGLVTPIVIVSDAHPHESQAVVRLLAIGAQDYVEKSKMAQDPSSVKTLFMDLVRSSHLPMSIGAGTTQSSVRPTHRPDLILIGASTGGPQALGKLLAEMPGETPPIVVTQHISAKFARPLADRLCEVSSLHLGRVDDGALLEPGHLYMALGDYHVAIGEAGGRLILRTSKSPAYNGHRPSVDYLFNSAIGLRHKVMALLLTGMGRDGALGLRFLHHEGAFCIAQSEQDCIVYGMPREAVERGAADFVGTIDEIRRVMLASFILPTAVRRAA